MGRSNADRAQEWARLLNELQRARGALLVTEGQAWVVDTKVLPLADLARWIASPRLAVPAGARPIGTDELVRVRDAVRTISAARSLRRLVASGQRPLRKWRGVDLSVLLADAAEFTGRLAAAIQAATAVASPPVHGVATGPILPQVLSDRDVDLDAESLVRFVESAGVRPGVGALDLRVTAVTRHLTIATRWIQLGRVDDASRWLTAAETRWWPSADSRRELTELAAQLDVAVPRGPDLDAFADRLREWRSSHPEATGWDFQPPTSRGSARAVLVALLEHLSREQQHLAPAARLLLLGPPLADIVAVVTEPLPDLFELAYRFDGADQTWVQRAGPTFVRCVADGWTPPDWVDRVAPHLAVAAMGLRLDRAPRDGWNQAGLSRQIAVVTSAQHLNGHEQEWLRQDWVAEIVNSPLGDVALGVALAPGRLRAGAENALAALALGMAGDRPVLTRRVNEWARPPAASNDAGHVEFAQLVGMRVAELAAYLHYRHLSGEAATLPRQAMELLDARPDGQATGRQLARLTDMLAGDDLPVDRRKLLERERERLLDPAAAAARWEAARRRVRNELRRATAQYRLSSLRRIFYELVEDQLGEITGKVPLDLLVGVLALGTDTNADPALVRRSLEAARRGRRTVDWPENREWLNRAHGRISLEPWLAGFDETRQVGEETIRYVTEFNLVRAAHMGTWFGTCLSLGDKGFNRASALTNAIEVNRLVVYGLDVRGNVVARKLVAVSSDWTLLGFRTYAHRDRALHKVALDEICRELSIHCGLDLAHSGRPESLTGAFWYDDGVEAWEVPHPVTENQPGRSTRTTLDGHVLVREADIAEGTDDDAGALLERVNRHLPSDEASNALMARVWRSELIAGLWLDGRIADPVSLVARIMSDGDSFTELELMPSVDPDGFTDVLIELAGQRRSFAFGPWLLVLTAPDERSVIAAARLGPPLVSWMLHLLPPIHAGAHLANAASYFPSDFQLRLLVERGTSSRQMLKGLQRLSIEHADGFRMLTLPARPTHWCEAWPTTMLRSGLAERDTAEQAAVELAMRYSTASARKVWGASERWPDSVHIAVAAAILGVPSPSLDVLQSEVDSLDRAVIRALLHVRQDLHIADDRTYALDILEARGDGMDVPSAVAAAADCAWDDLRWIAERRPTLLDHPAVSALARGILAGHDRAMQRDLATTMSRIDWQRVKGAPHSASLGDLAGIAFCSYSTFSGSRPADDLAVIQGCAGVHEVSSSCPYLGPVAAQIARRLSTTDLLDAIHATRQFVTVEQEIFEHLEWVLAPRLRDLPIPEGLTATQMAVLLDAAFLRLNADDSDQVATRVLAGVSDEQLATLVQRVSDPGDFWTWFSLTQRRVLLTASERIPEVVQRAVEALPAALDRTASLRGLRKSRVGDRTLRREWLRGLVGLSISEVPCEP